MYVALQNREGDMREFFSHEVQSFPPALSEFGNLRLPSAKSDLLKCLQPNSYGQTDSPTQFDCKVLDGAVIVHCLPTVEASTFDEYTEKVFIPHLQQQLHQSKCVDVVWDTYVPDSLKDATREKRGQGVRRKVAGQTKLPKNWMMTSLSCFPFQGSTIPMAQWQSIVYYIRLVTALKCIDFYLIIISMLFNL